MEEMEIGLNNPAIAIGQISTASDIVDDELLHEISLKSGEEGQSAARSIDNISRFVFPLSCLIFNVAFFAYYL